MIRAFTVGLGERILRHVTDRPKRVPDHGAIRRIEWDLDAERRAEDRKERHRAAASVCAREGHLGAEESCEITAWGSAVPLYIIAACPRCGEPADDIPVEQIDAALKLRSIGLL